MIKPFVIGLVLATIIIFFLNSLLNSALADTNTVSSTVIDKSVPTANAPSVVVNNSDICKTAASMGIQTQILGIANGITIVDENCERIKLSRSLYAMGMKVASVSLLCSDARVFDAMWQAGTYCPFQSSIGDEAKKGWEDNPHLVPEGSLIFEDKEIKRQETKNESNNDFEKFIFYGMALYTGVSAFGFPFFF